MNGTFEGYPQGLDLLDRIGGASKDEFATLKPRWDAEVLEPSKALVDTLGPMLRDQVSSGLQWSAKVNGSISPIVRDLRFAKDKSRQYKDFLMFTFWEGPDKKSAPRIKVRLMTEGAGFSVGAAFTPEALEKWRAALMTPAGPKLVASLEALDQSDATCGFFEPELKRPAAEVPDDSPVRDLLKHKTFFAYMRPSAEPPEREARLAQWLANEAVRLAPVHNWLVEHTQ